MTTTRSKPGFWEHYTPALVSVWREGRYGSADLTADVAAGATVGIIALPLAMAFAIASGVTPERGIFTAIVAGFLISALGGSRNQVGGPTGAFVVIVYGVVARHGYDGLVLATLMAGVILLIMAAARFGQMIKFIPYPVTTGFTSGIALIIFSSQVKDFLGLRMGAVPAEFVEKWEAYARHIADWNPAAFGVGAGSLALILLVRRLDRRIPGAIVAVIAASAAVWAFALPVETVGSRFGGIPRLLPAPSLPVISLARVRDLARDATTIALLAAIESLLSAVVADGMTGRRHRSDCELGAQGLANIAAALFGGIPATGAIARTATSIKAGARTPVAGMIHAAVLFLCLFALAPLAERIPLACLAAVLIVVSWDMSEHERFRHLLRAPKSDIAVLLTTFGLTVLVDLTVAVQVGVVLASLLFMKRMSEVTSAARGLFEEDEEESQSADPQSLSRRKVPEGVEVFEINGPFFFGVADTLQDALGTLEKPPKAFILRMRRVPAIDASGLHALDDFRQKCRRQGTALILTEVQYGPAQKISRMGLDAAIGREHIVPRLDAALALARKLAEEP